MIDHGEAPVIYNEAQNTMMRSRIYQVGCGAIVVARTYYFPGVLIRLELAYAVGDVPVAHPWESSRVLYEDGVWYV